jgi:hypothetical protein
MLYNAIFKSHLEYCIEVWGGAIETEINKLFTLQKKAIRALTHSHYNAHTDPIFGSLKQLKLKDIYGLNCAKLSHDIIKKRCPDSISTLFPIHNSCVNTRSSTVTNLYVPVVSSNSLARLPQVTVPRVWNQQPEALKTAMRSLMIANFKNIKIDEYNQFVCAKKKCYSCNQ